jgi:polysaccharide export outer membrane protein
MLGVVSARIPALRMKVKMWWIDWGCASAPRRLESCKVMQRIPNFLSYLLKLVVFLGVVGFLQVALAQQTDPVQDTTHQGPVPTEPSGVAPGPPTRSPEQNTTWQANSSALAIGPGDEVDVAVYGAPDLSGHTRVSADGNIFMPLIGEVRIAGLSSSEAAVAITIQLQRNNIINDPQVSVYVREYTASGISVSGEVAKPGFYSAVGPHRLFDILQAAGGPTDRASNKVVISHRDQDPKDATTLFLSKDPAEMTASNVVLQPGDTVVVPRAGIIYVLGEVNRPGGYVINSTGGITILQIVAVAGGPTHVASAGKTRLLRRSNNGFQEQQIDVKKLLRGKAKDVPVRDQDILFIPTSGIKSAINSASLVATAASVAIYRVPF